MRWPVRVWRISRTAGAVAAILIPLPAAAQSAWTTAIERASSSKASYGWREIYGGVDAARDQWLMYSGITVASPRADIYSNGWRLRIGGGYGRYSYDASQVTNYPCGPTAPVPCIRENRHYVVSHSYAEALVGYSLKLGNLTAKAFAGALMSSQQRSKPDPHKKTDGTEWGAKGSLELWLDMGPRSWSSLDLSYATARDETAARWRAGWRIKPRVSVGPEFRFDKNIESGAGEWNGRAGLFGRYEWDGGELSLAGGLAARVNGWSHEDASPFGTLNVLFQY
jgi:hypothetical protein